MARTINVQVDKTGNENSANLIRRFTKRVQGSGILRRIRTIRYHSRPVSKFTRKKKALKSLEKKNKYQELIKSGKISEQSLRYRRRRR